MISYIDEPNGSVTFILSRSDYIWRNGRSEPRPIEGDGDIILGFLSPNYYGDITDAKVIIDEIRRRLGPNEPVRRRRLQVEEMKQLEDLMREWVRDDIEYIDAFLDEILETLQLQPPEEPTDGVTDH